MPSGASPWLYALLGLTLLVGLNQVALAVRSHLYLRRKRGRAAGGSYRPKAVLICPCRGLDPGFADNVRAMLDLDDPDYEAVFVVGDAADPAHAALSAILAESGRGTLLVAGRSRQRGAKVHNLLAAVDAPAARACDVLVFIDSDVRPHRSWLRELVQPLADPAVGLATGYRWYRPKSNRLGSWMRAVGNNVGMAPYILSDDAPTAWGGAMAVRRSDFDRSGVLDVWPRALDDDVTLSNRIRALGLRVEFVPRCLTVSSEDCTLADYFQWLRRQSFMVKVYNPALWRLSFVSFLPMALMLCGAAALAASAVAPEARIYALVLLLVVPLQMAGGVLTAAVFRDRQTALWVPVGVLISGAMSVLAMLATAFSDRISWRGIDYEVAGPQEVRILD